MDNNKTEEKILKLIYGCAITAIVLLCAVTVFIGIVSCKCNMPNMGFIIMIKCIAFILITAIICLTIIIGMRLKNKEKLKKQEELKETTAALREAYKKVFENKKCEYCSCVGNAQSEKTESNEKENPSKESNDSNKS